MYFVGNYVVLPSSFRSLASNLKTRTAKRYNKNIDLLFCERNTDMGTNFCSGFRLIAMLTKTVTSTNGAQNLPLFYLEKRPGKKLVNYQNITNARLKKNFTGTAELFRIKLRSGKKRVNFR